MHIHSFGVMAFGLGMLSAVSVTSAQDIAGMCGQKCESRNLPASCTWLTHHPRRCLQKSVRACVRGVRRGMPVACPLSPDLRACLTDHGCPFGARCVDTTCQVVPCTAPCGPLDQCQGNACLVGDCLGSSENCPAGFHCESVDDPFLKISGACKQNDPHVRYCTSDVDCITPGTFNLVCARGHCVQGALPRRPHPSTTITSTSSTTSTTMCADVFDCSGGAMCCRHSCVPDPFANMGICSTTYTAPCTLCASDSQCACNGIFCDTCEGTASLSGCVDPCDPQAE